MAAAFLILRSGVLSWAARGLQERRPRPLVTAFMLAMLFFALDFVVELPWTSYARWWREGEYGLTSQPWTGWLIDRTIITTSQLPVYGA